MNVKNIIVVLVSCLLLFPGCSSKNDTTTKLINGNMSLSEISTSLQSEFSNDYFKVEDSTDPENFVIELNSDVKAQVSIFTAKDKDIALSNYKDFTTGLGNLITGVDGLQTYGRDWRVINNPNTGYYSICTLSNFPDTENPYIGIRVINIPEDEYPKVKDILISAGLMEEK